MKWLTKEEQRRLWEFKDQHKVKCKCGHVNIIVSRKGYQLCTWCKNYVFATPQKEFEFRLKERQIKERRINNEI